MNTNIKISPIISAIGSVIAMHLGGWDAGLKALVFIMCADYITGLTVAGVFHNSPKTDHGGLESNAGFKGLMKKIAILVCVIICQYIDVLVGTTFLRDACVIGFIINELMSIIENFGLMGVPLPKAVYRAIDILQIKLDDIEQITKDKGDKDDEQRKDDMGQTD